VVGYTWVISCGDTHTHIHTHTHLDVSFPKQYRIRIRNINLLSVLDTRGIWLRQTNKTTTIKNNQNKSVHEFISRKSRQLPPETKNTSSLTTSGLKHRLALQWLLNISYYGTFVVRLCWGNVTFCILVVLSLYSRLMLLKRLLNDTWCHVINDEFLHMWAAPSFRLLLLPLQSAARREQQRASGARLWGARRPGRRAITCSAEHLSHKGTMIRCYVVTFLYSRPSHFDRFNFCLKKERRTKTSGETYLLDALSCCILVNAPKLFRTVRKLARTWRERDRSRLNHTFIYEHWKYVDGTTHS